MPQNNEVLLIDEMDENEMTDEMKHHGEIDLQAGKSMDEDEITNQLVIVMQQDTNSTQNEQLSTEPEMAVNDPGPNGRNRPKPAYKRVELCIMDKVRVIAAGASGLSQRQIAKQFGISKTQVQTLLKRKDEVMRCYNEGQESWRKRANSKFRRHSYEDINELVSQWYSQQENKEAITGPMLKSKAMGVSVELGLGEEFKASNGWLECFKRRYDIQIGSSKSETNDSATMVTIQRNQISDGVENRNAESDESKNRRTEGASELQVSINHEINQSNLPRAATEQRDPKIHNVFSMQPGQAVIHSVRPVLLPASSIYQAQPVSLMSAQQNRPTQAYHPISNSLQTLAEVVGQETPTRIQIKSFNEALRYANALKAFAVEQGSVTLIGLMTAMEHELQREGKISTI